MEDETATYMGQKGYTIYKENLDIDEQIFLRKDLEAKPYVPKSSLNKPKSFAIYRESHKKFYIPRFYGYENYGVPDEFRLTKGKKINIKFKGELRDFQKPIVDTYLKSAKTKGGGLLEIHTGAGKTVMGLKIIAELGVKTIIIVHKEFLLRQWIERMEQFLPEARVGKIQGSIIDTEDKDVVICMLQSISMKEYPVSLFSEFGLTVVDECHHISAEVFSRSLFKIVTKYTLGLSATMKRKDGLTSVIKMFLGDVVYKKVREGEDNVLVKAITYDIDDEEFNEIEYNFKGQVHYSKMIKKLCEFNRRTEFILKVLKNEIETGEKDSQIMILGHNKVLLHYLHDAIKSRNISTVGYYVGGMKEKDLKLSEGKKVIIGTYAMAEEGLDIKTLTTLIMATPKVDVTQAVGRILRRKHKQATVIDIIDTHSIFQRHWGKRRAFYRKQKFNVLHATLNDYKNNRWQTLIKDGKMKRKKKQKITVETETLKGVCLINLED